MVSFNATLDQYRHLLAEQSEDRLSLINENFDVGRVTEAGQYRLADDSYAELLDRLTEHGKPVDTALSAPISTTRQETLAKGGKRDRGP